MADWLLHGNNTRGIQSVFFVSIKENSLTKRSYYFMTLGTANSLLTVNLWYIGFEYSAKGGYSIYHGQLSPSLSFVHLSKFKLFIILNYQKNWQGLDILYGLQFEIE